MESLLKFVLQPEAAAAAGPWAERGALFLFGLAVTWALGRMARWRRKAPSQESAQLGQRMIELLERMDPLKSSSICCWPRGWLRRWHVFVDNVDVTADLTSKDRKRIVHLCHWRKEMRNRQEAKNLRAERDASIRKALWG
jgi:hypothetical protein